MKAIGDYEAQEDDHLSFVAGEIIKVVEKDDSGWWKGKKENEEALLWFPSNFVQEIEEKESQEEEQGESNALQKLDSITQDSQKLNSFSKAKRRTQAPSNKRGFVIGNTVETVERVEVIDAPSQDEPRRPNLPMGVPMGMNMALNLAELKGKMVGGLKKTNRSEKPPIKSEPKSNPFKNVLRSSMQISKNQSPLQYGVKNPPPQKMPQKMPQPKVTKNTRRENSDFKSLQLDPNFLNKMQNNPMFSKGPPPVPPSNSKTTPQTSQTPPPTSQTPPPTQQQAHPLPQQTQTPPTQQQSHPPQPNKILSQSQPVSMQPPKPLVLKSPVNQPKSRNPPKQEEEVVGKKKFSYLFHKISEKKKISRNQN